MAGTSGNIKKENEGFKVQVYVPNTGIIEPPPGFPHLPLPPGFSSVPPSPGFPFIPLPPHFSYMSRSERLPPLPGFPSGEMNFVKQEEIHEDLKPLIPVPEVSDSTGACIKKIEDSCDALQVEPVPPGIDFIDDPDHNVAKKAGFFILKKDYFLKVMRTNKWNSIQCPTSSSIGMVTPLPLTERIQGWIEERRPRISNGRIDKFYYHQKTNKTFRTFLSMLRFAKYGAVPKRPQKDPRGVSKKTRM